MTQEQIDEYLQGDNPFKISKELLSNVLNKQIFVVFCDRDGKTIRYYNNPSELEEINIYELAHKCKEWACSKGYDCLSDTTTNMGCNSYLYEARKSMNRGVCLESFLGNMEYEAIFIACEWILDNEYS